MGAACFGRTTEAEGRPLLSEGSTPEAENFIHAEVEQAEQVGSLNPRLAGSERTGNSVRQATQSMRKRKLMFQRSPGVSVAAHWVQIILTWPSS